MKIKKNDIVKILSGKDKGKQGKVLRVLPAQNKIVIEGLNLSVKHVRPKKAEEKGQRIKMAMPLSLSNVTLICPRCKKTVRVGYKVLKNGNKRRFCRKCKDVFK
ncbi:50S ribosomal protein L24 [Patescibacteria group bacterium]|nr:50S ribosomal protein L24 [Patescibacteria group bacterium]